MYTKSELKSLWSKYDFKPRKKSGQNFLIDKNIKNKIISELRLTKSDRVLEIGQGFGQLTLDLAGSAGIVYAVEKDKKIYEIFNAEFDKIPNLELINGDILKIDLERFYKGTRLTVVGNLPYYITTPILEDFIRHRHLLKDIFITVQKEVSERIAAEPGSGDYSSLSIFIQFYTAPAVLFGIKASCFFPQPKVDSHFLRLKVRDRPKVNVREEEMFFKIVRKSFQQRRKMILNSLSHKDTLGVDKKTLEGLLVKAGIRPTARPQEISIESFARLSNSFPA